MIPSRRLTLASVSALALAACTTTAQQSATATVQAVFNACQFILPLVDALALGISVAVPASAGVLGAVTGYLNQAAPIFQAFVATMTVAQAQPLVAQIETYVAAAVNALASVVQNNPSLAAYQSRVAQAQAVVALLTTFVNGVQLTPKAALPVRLPLLHP